MASEILFATLSGFRSGQETGARHKIEDRKIPKNISANYHLVLPSLMEESDGASAGLFPGLVAGPFFGFQNSSCFFP